MTQPRNLIAFARGQRRRAMIRELLLDDARQHPLARPPTARQLQAELAARGEYLAVTSVHAHLQVIRHEAEQQSKERSLCNVSNTSTVLG